MKGRVRSICVSKEKGVQKTPVDRAEVIADFGIKGDAHAGNWPRQVSLLADESAEKLRQLGANIHAGDFGENILTEGIELLSLPIGAMLKVGDLRLQVTQIGKDCHTHCAIFDAVGTCVMPTEGIFCCAHRFGQPLSAPARRGIRSRRSRSACCARHPSR
jgi:MOSC domain-containing protein YiiM